MTFWQYLQQKGIFNIDRYVYVIGITLIYLAKGFTIDALFVPVVILCYHYWQYKKIAK